MDTHCEVCDEGKENRAILEIGITHLGVSGKLRICATCSGAEPSERFDEHAPLVHILYALQRKMERLEEEARQERQG